MSGHSKWKTIQHKKGAADAKRGKIFSKMSKEIMIVAKAGGGKPENNAALRTVIAKARSYNMPADNIERAIKKGTGELAGEQFEEVVYEGYAGGGIALVVKVLTDNKNRAAAEVRHVFTKFGTNFAAQGAVSRGFKRRGQILVDLSAVEEDKLMAIVLEAGADDMNADDGVYEILTDPSVLSQVTEALEKAGIRTENAEITMLPDVYVPVTDKALAAATLRFIDALEEIDDVQNVYTNMDLDAAIIKNLQEQK